MPIQVDGKGMGVFSRSAITAGGHCPCRNVFSYLANRRSLTILNFLFGSL